MWVLRKKILLETKVNSAKANEDIHLSHKRCDPLAFTGRCYKKGRVFRI